MSSNKKSNIDFITIDDSSNSDDHNHNNNNYNTIESIKSSNRVKPTTSRLSNKQSSQSDNNQSEHESNNQPTPKTKSSNINNNKRKLTTPVSGSDNDDNSNNDIDNGALDKIVYDDEGDSNNDSNSDNESDNDNSTDSDTEQENNTKQNKPIIKPLKKTNTDNNNKQNNNKNKTNNVKQPLNKKHKSSNDIHNHNDPDTQLVFDDSIHCATCNAVPDSIHDLQPHPRLDIPQCSECLDYINSIDLDTVRNDDGEKYCAWCADGGDVLGCDTCDNNFCIEDIKFNLGTKTLKQIKATDPWSCFLCEPSQLDSIIKPYKQWLQCDGMKVVKKRKSLNNKLRNSIRRKSKLTLNDDDFDDDNKHRKHKSKHERRDIRTILDDKNLSRDAISAQNAEQKRLAELNDTSIVVSDIDNDNNNNNKKKSKNNDIVDTTDQHVKRILVNVHYKKFHEQPIYLSSYLSQQLKPHQIDGVRFLWQNIVQSIDKCNNVNEYEGFGCIISHFMGLGKTLTTISFVDIYMRQCKFGRHILIISPVNTLKNWHNEFIKWINNKYERPRIIQLDDYNNNKSRYNILESWNNRGGVCIIGYELFRILTTVKLKINKMNRANATNDNDNIKLNKNQKLQNACADILLNNTNLLVVDEGHRIKNENTTLTQTLKLIKTKKRIILTGSM